MRIHKRFLAGIIVAAALAVAPLMFAPSGNAAAPYVTTPTLTVPTTSIPCAGVIPLSGADFVPGSTLTVTLLSSGPVVLGTVVVSPNGTFSKSFTLPPGISGPHVIRASGPATATNSNTAEATITIGPCATTPPPTTTPVPPPSTAPVTVPTSPAPPPSKPSLAFTGVQIFGMVAVVVGLVVIGGALVYFGRRRKGAA